jgi:AAA+ superfamily predicted ATPase
VLEYYEGVLFLTTNQIAQFDVAVQSRIHIAIKYQNLGGPQMSAIFKMVLDKYPSNLIEDREELEQYATSKLLKKNFDGRQIRNIVTTAMGFARSKDQKLGRDHISQVMGLVEDFKNDLYYQMQRWQEDNSRRI